MTLDADKFEALSDRVELFYVEGSMQLDRIKDLALTVDPFTAGADFKEVCDWLGGVGELLADLYSAMCAEAHARLDDSD